MFIRALTRLQPRLLAGMGARVSQTPPSGLTRSLAILSGASRSSSRSSLCSCGCGIHGIHTRGDRELVEFLQAEIVAEKKNLSNGLPSHVDDFAIKLTDAEVTLTKNFHDEKITVTLNVNHTVDTDEAEMNQEQTEASLKSRPSFEVDLEVGSKTMSFTCSFSSVNVGEEQQEASEDVFGINELTMYEGEWSDATYCVSGDILDGMMYDLLMNLLEERGITNEFAEKLSSLCSDYEHSLYVSLLENVQDFVKRK